MGPTTDPGDLLAAGFFITDSALPGNTGTNLVIGATSQGPNGNISADGPTTAPAFDGTFTLCSSIPEPSGFGMGAIVLLGYRGVKRKQAA